MNRKLWPYVLAGVLLMALLVWNYRQTQQDTASRPHRVPISEEVVEFADDESIIAMFDKGDAVYFKDDKPFSTGSNLKIDKDALRDCFALARWENVDLPDGILAMRFRANSSPLSPQKFSAFEFDDAASTIEANEKLKACVRGCAEDWSIGGGIRLGQEVALKVTFKSLQRGRSKHSRKDAPEPSFELTPTVWDKDAKALGPDPFAIPEPGFGAEQIDWPQTRQAQVKLFFERHREQADYCRARTAQRGMATDGKLSIAFDIGTDGALSEIRLAADKGKALPKFFADCERRYLSSWRFPALAEGTGEPFKVARGMTLSDLPQPPRKKASQPNAMPIWHPMSIMRALMPFGGSGDLAGDEDGLAVVLEKPWRVSLTRAQVAKVVRQHMDDFESCLDDATRESATDKTEFTLRLTLKGDGSVKSGGYSTSIPNSRLFLNCMNIMVTNWRFPEFTGLEEAAPKSGSVQPFGHRGFARARTDEVEVSIPFWLKPVAKRAKPKNGQPPQVRFIPRGDEIDFDVAGMRQSLAMAFAGKRIALAKCRGPRITFVKGPHEPIPLFFEISPNGRVLPESIELGGGAPAGEVVAESAPDHQALWFGQNESVTEAFEMCVRETVREWQFQEGFSRGAMSVRMPVVFATKEELEAESKRYFEKLKQEQEAAQGQAGPASTPRTRPASK